MQAFDNFTLSLITLNRQVQKIKETEMAAFGLKGNQVMLLYFLGQNKDGLTASQLSKMSLEDKAAISRSLSKLESLGIVAPVRTDGSKRDYRVKRFLTPYGQEIVSQMANRINAVMRQGSAGLSEANRNAFYSSMKTISDNLDSILRKEN